MAVVESNLESGDDIGSGLNDGILYLMSTSIFSCFFVIWNILFFTKKKTETITGFLVMQKIFFYFQLLKFKLSVTVVFSAMGYLIGVDNFILNEFVLLIIGGILVTGSVNGFNQILEKDYDKLMFRTSNNHCLK